ncbi:MAG: amidohydrolase family protein [Deltaproteobacteria bacterium]|jgi:cytosine/adenosine deaminase-related metal-dependent hydrolase|nr:amidohydrolase family protein [Deltaproteobacteria bacterium]
MNGPWKIAQQAEIHRAEWLAPVSAPPVQNGAVLTSGGRVVAAGPFQTVKKECPAGARTLDHGRAALFPALVNAHTHLELFALKGKIAFPQPGFRQWITLLFDLRASMGKDFAAEGLRLGEQEIFSSGTGLCGDITNGGAAARSGFQALERRIFLELLGFNLPSLETAMPPDLQIDGAGPIPVPHSVYSVSSPIIAECKDWTRARGLPFTMHVAEHFEEIEFLNGGKGFCRELLERLGRWDPAWKPPGKTPVEYLDRLGVLDSNTLLVHAVHMSDSDWALAATRNCAVVFCPRSNRNLGAGRPRIEKALSLGLDCCLATDSLASNLDLDLFAEAGHVLYSYPSIDPRKILEMITVKPARSLGRAGEFGCIEPGAKANMLAVAVRPGVNESSLAEALIESGKEGAWKWVSNSPG